MSDLLAELQQKQEDFFTSMMRAFAVGATEPGEQEQQFFRAYFHVVEAAAQGNLQPREDFLSAIVPGLRMMGISLGGMISGLSTIQLAFVAELSRAHLPWYIQFCKEYAETLARFWETPES